MVHSIGSYLRRLLFRIVFLTICFIDIVFSLSLSSSTHLVRTMTELDESTQSSRVLFPLLGDNNFAPWRQRMSDQLKELDLW